MSLKIIVFEIYLQVDVTKTARKSIVNLKKKIFTIFLKVLTTAKVYLMLKQGKTVKTLYTNEIN